MEQGYHEKAIDLLLEEVARCIAQIAALEAKVYNLRLPNQDPGYRAVSESEIDRVRRDFQQRLQQ